jgi:hypothetical protein
MRRAAHEAGQAVIMVIALSMLLMTVGVMLVAQTIQTDPLIQSNTIQHTAYRGLEAGMNAYQSIVNTNPNLANCNSGTNGSALCQGAQYQKWNLVSNTDGGNGTIPEWYLFDNPQPVFNADGSLSSLQVQIVGVAGFLNHYAFQSSVANMASVNGFLTTLWWSDFEASDTNVGNPVYTGPNAVCKYNWANSYGGPGSNCDLVAFGPGDVINGPVFANDSIYVSGSPTFGTSTVPLSVKTHDPSCLFVNGTSSTCSKAVANYTAVSAISAYAQAQQTPPSDDSSLQLVANIAAPNNGCVYYGPTTITLTGVSLITAGTMTVVSPDTVTASPGCPLNTLGVGGNMTPGNLPPNGVIYINNAVASGNANSRVVVGANPFDELHTYYPAFPASDNGKYAQTCADNGNGMPCYFGWTGSKQDSEGDAFVSGSLATSSTGSGVLTIGTSNDIIIDGSLTYTDCSTSNPNEWVGTPQQSACNYRTDHTYPNNDVLGLIANQYVEVSHPVYPTDSPWNCYSNCHQKGDPLPKCGASGALAPPLCTPVDASGNITIDAAILALTQSFGVNNYTSGSAIGKIILYGSLQQEARGAVGTFNPVTNQVVSGFSKYYTWDPRLELVAPPSYLNPGTASYNLNSSAISSSLNYPALHYVYGAGGTFQCPQPPLTPNPLCPVVPAL